MLGAMEAVTHYFEAIQTVTMNFSRQGNHALDGGSILRVAVGFYPSH
jgi:hypothetical protein